MLADELLARMSASDISQVQMITRPQVRSSSHGSTNEWWEAVACLRRRWFPASAGPPPSTLLVS